MTDYYRNNTDEILDIFNVQAERGLSAKEVRQRRQQYGKNLLRQSPRRSVWSILVDQVKSVIVGLLAFACLVSFQFGKYTEGIAIFAVLVINTAIGFTTELKAVRTMESLRRMARVTTRVRREGQSKEVPAEDLVPGDVVPFEGGDIVTADLRVIEASKLYVDESAMTGESVPVRKTCEALQEEVSLAERRNMLFKGTALTRGSGEGVVVATGMETELGQISSLAEEAESEVSPLEKRLDRLGGQLVWITLVLAGIVAISGVAAGKDLFLMIETGIALAVAAVPEGLPIVATMALARGMWRMARRNVLIERLSAVETLGATTAVFTDKTGTLTENRMTVTQLALAHGTVKVGTSKADQETPASVFELDGEPIDLSDDPLLYESLQVAVLCNNASLPKQPEKEGGLGDPMEVALLEAGEKAGIERNRLTETMPEEREEAFDPDTKMMATYHQKEGRLYVAVKGAPEAVLDVSTTIQTREEEKELTDGSRDEWREQNQELAREGLRILALATKTTDSIEEDPYKDLKLLGLIGLLDPPRQDVPEAVAACKRAGVNVVMVTGDQIFTAWNIADSIGLIEDESAPSIQGKELKPPEDLSEDDRNRLLKAPVFARVSPKEKLDLIALYQANGDVVAMTGDGVNDAPALKKADIGVAMGQRGSQVAREAADMVLRDDAFPSIVAAMEQGRVIFGNIRKFLLYLLSCNLGQILVVSMATVSGLPLPILPLQILFLNVVTDVFPAFALGAGEGESDIMSRPPRDPKEPILARNHWVAIGLYGVLIAIATLLALVLSLHVLDMDTNRAVTVSFLTLAFVQLWHVFNMRDRESRLLSNEVTRNPLIWGSIALCAILTAGAVYTPLLSDVLKVSSPGLEGWSLAISSSFLPCIIGQATRSRFPH